MPKQTLASMLRLLAKCWLHLISELKELDATLEQLTAQTAKRLRSQFGVGPQNDSTLGYISPMQLSKTGLRHI
jgi:transposase